jgi:phosphoribosyl 1,2-cyclic phosphate phosphodiesterase
MMVMFDYIFEQNGAESWRPHLLTNIVANEFTIFNTQITPVEIYHGRARIFGYRIGSAAYLTDCSGIPPESMKKLKNLDVLIIGALRHKTHPTHMNVTQALEVSAALKPKRTIFTHLSHNIDFDADSAKLPNGVEFAYDGMEIEV